MSFLTPPTNAASGLVRRFRAAILAGDEPAAEAVTRIAVRWGMTRTEICHRVLAPALHDVGAMWAAGTASVLEEHVATAVTTAVMSRLPSPGTGSEPTGPSAVVGCAAPEEHALGARMVAETLRHDGWDVVYVGAAVPASDLVAFSELRRPHLVCLSISVVAHIQAAGDVTRSLRSLASPPVVLAGGWGCGAVAAESIGADGMGRDLTALPRLARELCGAHAV